MGGWRQRRGDASTGRGTPWLRADEAAGAGGAEGADSPPRPREEPALPTARRRPGLQHRERTHPDHSRPQPEVLRPSRRPQGAGTEAVGAPHVAASAGPSALGAVGVGRVQGLKAPRALDSQPRAPSLVRPHGRRVGARPWGGDPSARRWVSREEPRGAAHPPSPPAPHKAPLLATRQPLIVRKQESGAEDPQEQTG